MLQRLLFAFLLTGAILLAQTDTGLVTGFVTDPSGAAIPGATVTLRSADTGRTYTARSAETGSYTIGAVVPGAYELTVEAKGFARSRLPDLLSTSSPASRPTCRMKVGDITETVEVTASAPLLESQNTSVGQVVENKTIVTLPLNGRNYSQLVALMPGATETPDPGQQMASASTASERSRMSI